MGMEIQDKAKRESGTERALALLEKTDEVRKKDNQIVQALRLELGRQEQQRLKENEKFSSSSSSSSEDSPSDERGIKVKIKHHDKSANHQPYSTVVISNLSSGSLDAAIEKISTVLKQQNLGIPALRHRIPTEKNKITLRPFSDGGEVRLRLSDHHRNKVEKLGEAIQNSLTFR